METRHLGYFATVVECGSITKAANQLNMTQPGLSRIIQRLEDEFGVPLFERTGRGMELTSYGQALQDHRPDLERSLSDIRAELHALKDGRSGELSLGCGGRWVNGMLPLAISKMIVRCPNVHFTIRSGEWNVLLEQVANGELDFLLGALPEALNPDLTCQRIVVDRMFLTARQGHPLATRSHVTLADTLEYGWIVPRKNDFIIQIAHAAYAKQNLPFPRSAVNTASRNVTTEILRNTDLLCLLPDFQITQTGQGLTRLNCPELSFSRMGGVIYRKNRQMLSIMRELIDELQLIAADLTGEASAPDSPVDTVEKSVG